jgi:hypothetical protein
MERRRVVKKDLFFLNKERKVAIERVAEVRFFNPVDLVAGLSNPDFLIHQVGYFRLIEISWLVGTC